MSSTEPQPPAFSWRLIAPIWIGLALTTGTQVVIGMRAVGMRHNWIALFLVSAAVWLVWAIATPLVLWLGRRFPPVKALGWKGWSWHVATVAAIGTIDACWMAALQLILNPFAVGRWNPSYRNLAIEAFYGRFHVDLIAYAAILAIGYTTDSLRRLAIRDAEAARLSAELSRAQLDALRRQMEPHFLFNTLHGIAGLVRDHQNGPAVQMIACLSDLLRRVLEGADRQTVPLAEELSFLERYIELQIMRFGHRLTVQMEMPLELYGAQVPPLILQPLVENAIVHGIGKSVDGGSIRVGASERGGVLTLYVYNDGPALPPGGVQQSIGVGLSNTRGRLKTLYGTASALELRNRERGGVETIVRVPYRVE
jgi:two-component system, LytTR family, sensor kinase